LCVRLCKKARARHQVHVCVCVCVCVFDKWKKTMCAAFRSYGEQCMESRYQLCISLARAHSLSLSLSRTHTHAGIHTQTYVRRHAHADAQFSAVCFMVKYAAHTFSQMTLHHDCRYNLSLICLWKHGNLGRQGSRACVIEDGER
jgi:hypothetical protein